MIPISEFIIRMLLSFAIGLAIGFERQFRNRHAGMRTFAVLCMASCLLGILSSSISPPVERSSVLIAVLAGMSFLGAGVIHKEKNKELVIYGLTTSTTLLMTSAIGIAIGLGYLTISIISALLTLICLIFVRFFEVKVGLKRIKKTDEEAKSEPKIS